MHMAFVVLLTYTPKRYFDFYLPADESKRTKRVLLDGFVNLNISLNSIASLGSLASAALALLFCFLLIRRSLSIVTSWS